MVEHHHCHRLGSWDLEGSDYSLIEVLFQHLLRGMEGNNEILSQDSMCPSRDLNQEPAKY
jgi:hypothetical protein